MRWLPLLFVLSMTSPAWAEPPAVQDIPPGEDRIVTLQQGQPAPFTGQLFDNGTALRWANWLQQYKLRLKEDVEAQVAVCQLEVKYRNDLLRVEEDRAKKVEEDLRKRLSESEQQRIKLEQQLLQGPPWYEGMTFGIIVGVASSAAVLSLSLWALEARQ